MARLHTENLIRHAVIVMLFNNATLIRSQLNAKEMINCE
jgi:hypothetical protein